MFHVKHLQGGGGDFISDEMKLDLWRAFVSAVLVVLPVLAATIIALLNRIIRRLNEGQKQNETRDAQRQELIDTVKSIGVKNGHKHSRISDGATNVPSVSPSRIQRRKNKRPVRKNT